MNEIKLEKVSELLYHEPHKNKSPILWKKRLHSVFLTLTDIRVDLCLEIKRPETDLFAHINHQNEEKSEQGDVLSQGEEETEKYSEQFAWRIRATGHFSDRDEMSLIRKDGTVTGRTECFNNTDVLLKSVSDWDERKNSGGFLLYIDSNSEREPFLHLELLIPAARLDGLCNELVSGRLCSMEVAACVEVFQSQAVGFLSEPHIWQQFSIEEDGGNDNRAYLSRLTAFRSITGGDTR